MTTAQFAVVSAPIDAAAVASAVTCGEPGREGAVVTFIGAVRGENGGRRVRHLDYEAYAPLAERVFAQIAGEAASEWPGVRIAIHHRVGRLVAGEASVVIAAASPHRAEAFAGCRVRDRAHQAGGADLEARGVRARRGVD